MCLFHTQRYRIFRDCLISTSGKIGKFELKVCFCRLWSSKGEWQLQLFWCITMLQIRVKSYSGGMHHQGSAGIQNVLNRWTLRCPWQKLILKNAKILKQKNLGCVALLRTWRKYLDLVAPGQSPIASFLWHPQFLVAARCSDFWLWGEKGLTQFYSIGRRWGIYLEKEMKQKMEGFGGFEYQYRQVYNLIMILQQQDDVFRPLTYFEWLAVNIQGQRKVLAWLYNWLLTKTKLTRDERVKWEQHLKMSFSTSQWERINMFNQTFSSNTNIKESQYKMLHMCDSGQSV